MAAPAFLVKGSVFNWLPSLLWQMRLFLWYSRSLVFLNYDGFESLVFIVEVWPHLQVWGVHIALFLHIFGESGLVWICDCLIFRIFLPRILCQGSFLKDNLFDISHIYVGQCFLVNGIINLEALVGLFGILIFSLNPDLDVALLESCFAASTVLELILIIFGFEKLLKVLGLVDRRRKICKGVTEIERISTILKNELSHEAGQHLFFIIISFLNHHNIFNAGLKRSLHGGFEFVGDWLFCVDEIINNVFKLLQAPSDFKRVVNWLVLLFLRLKLFQEIIKCVSLFSKDSAHLLLVYIQQFHYVFNLLLAFEQSSKILGEKAISFSTKLAHVVVFLTVYRNIGLFLRCVVVFPQVRRLRLILCRRFHKALDLGLALGFLKLFNYIWWALSDQRRGTFLD